MSAPEETRPSLLNLFAAPGNRKGVFGLVCGLSADEQFMNSALDSFTGRSKPQRLYFGDISLALFYDIHNKPLQGVPGLYNPSPGGNMPEKIACMHAKVALLGFGESAAGQPDYYRLIVSTGNWTKEAVNNSINLVWFCDYDANQKEGQEQEAKDINEAVLFWQQLLGVNNGKSGYYQLDDLVRERIEAFLGAIARAIPAPGTGYTPRFISNLLDGKGAVIPGAFQADSMGAQVIQRFNEAGQRRNFIICGSGFFEQAATGDKIGEPEVIQNLLGNLPLTKKPERWLVVNPGTCGAAGPWMRSIFDTTDWVLCSPKHPEIDKSPYNFHAKYE